MEWLIRLWDKLIRDVILVLGGLAIAGSQVFAPAPNLYLLGFALALISPATAVRLWRISASQSGSSSEPSLPPGSPSPGPIPPPSPGGSGE